MLINVNVFKVAKSEAIQLCADYNLQLLEYDQHEKDDKPTLLIRGNKEDFLKFKNLYFKEYTDDDFMEKFLINMKYKELMQERSLISLNKSLGGKMFFEITGEEDLGKNITAYRLQFYNDGENVNGFIEALNYQNSLYLLINKFNVLGIYLFEVIDDAEVELEGLKKIYEDKAYKKINIIL